MSSRGGPARAAQAAAAIARPLLYGYGSRGPFYTTIAAWVTTGRDVRGCTAPL